MQTSLLQALLFMLDFQAARYLMTGDVPKQVGNNHPTGAPTGTYRTEDGHINIAPTPAMWRRFSAAIGRKDLIEDPDYATPVRGPPQPRRAQRPHRGDHVTKTSRSTHREKSTPREFRAARSTEVDEAFADPQVQQLGIAPEGRFQTRSAEISLIGQPVSLSRTPSRLVTSAPEYGEHTDDILGVEFGYSAEDITRFRQAGTI